MLSVVTATRNDGYSEDMLPRLNLFIWAMKEQALRHEMPVELILVEWNPPYWSRPLVDVIELEDPNEYFSLRVITVPEEIHERLENSEILDFYQFIAKNVGIRRAKYDWVACTCQDVIFSDEVFDFVASNPDGGWLYRAFRCDLPKSCFPKREDISAVLEQCVGITELGAEILDRQWKYGLHTEACGDFQMCHRGDWDHLRGYPEFHIWSIHIDSLFELHAHANHVFEKVIPDALVYHVEHDASWVKNPEMAASRPHIELAEVTAFGELLEHAGFHMWFSPEVWGLRDCELKETVLC